MTQGQYAIMGDCNNRCMCDAKLLLLTAGLLFQVPALPWQGLWLNWKCMVGNKAALQISFNVYV